MPYKNYQKALAAQRRWYAANNEKVIASVKARKHTLYAGVCRNCGGPTSGGTKKKIPEFCAKPECHAAQLRMIWFDKRRI